MGIKVDLDDELEKQFRELAMKKFGYSKGSIKKATESAIRMWTEEEKFQPPQKKKKNGKSAVDLLVGLLADTKVKGKKTSVQLQHETSKLWASHAER